MKNLFSKKVINRACLITFSLSLCFIFFNKKAYSQTSLSTGDVVFISFNSDDSTTSIKDFFQIMFLKAITAGTQITFTDQQYRDANGFSATNGSSETNFTWRATSSYAVGDKVRFWGSGGSTPYTANASSGVIDAGNGLSLSSTGDQIFAFQGADVDYDSLITGIHMNSGTGAGDANWDNGQTGTSTTGSQLPDILTNGTNAIRVHVSGAERDNWGYDCSTTSGSASALRTAIMDLNNWNGDDNNLYTYICTSTPTTTTWNGTTWSAGAPTSTIDAVIASSTTPGAFTCKDLTINSTYSLTLNSGVTATIHGDLTNSGNGTSGTGTLDFAGGAAQSLSGSAFTHAGVIEVTTGTTLTTNNLLTIGNGGSLMHGTGTDNGGGSISGNITVEKTIGSTTDGWRSFSLPVDDLIDNLETGLNTRCSNTSPTDRHNVYYWNGTVRGGSSNNVAEGWTVANNTTDDENKGYAIYLSNNSSGFFDFSSTISISGTPNDGSKTFNLDNTFDPEGDSSTSTQRGWNLIPNYFPSNLSVEDLINDGDFDPTYKAVHIWDQGAEQLKAINSSGLTNYNTSGGSIYSSTRQIPPFMAFWVKANANSQSIQLKNHMRTGRNDSLPANTFLKTNADILRLQVQDQENHIDQYSVAFIQNSTEDFDPEYDLYKFKSFSTEVPTIYSMHGPGDKLSLNALPLKEEYSIPLYFESYKNGRQYTISPITAEYSNHYNVELTDNKTAVTTDLLEKDYSFTHDKDYKNARFTLKLKRKTTTTIAELQNNERSYAYTNGNGINIVYRNNNTNATAKVEVYNMLGQKLFAQENITAGSSVSFSPTAGIAKKIYIVKVISGSKAKNIKVLY